MASGYVAQKSPASHTYSYSSQPRAAPPRRKYREDGIGSFKEDDKQVLYGNIMYDRRIIRGNTYAMTYPAGTAKPDPLEQQRIQEAKRRAHARKRAKEQMRIRSPDPVEGRKHIDVQTELYLEEITDRIEEADVQTQTDAFLNRPATPLFIPAKTGADVATQIEEGDLFDFDIEVKPILEVLVGKTVEQALMEVMEEEELASLRAQQREFEENRNAELVETQRLEEQERRHREEKERRMHQQREALLKEKETSEKIAARAFAQSYLNDLVPSVFSILHDSGYFYDTTEREIETTFVPWLMEEVSGALQKKIIARMVVDAMIKEIVKKKLGIIPEQSTASDNAAEGNEDASVPQRLIIEAGQDKNEDQAEKAEPTDDSQGTEEKEPLVEKPTEPTSDDQSSKDGTVEEKTEPKTEEQKTTEDQKTTEEEKKTTEEEKKTTEEQKTTEEEKKTTEEEKKTTEEQKETEAQPTQPPESAEEQTVIVEETKTEEKTSSEEPKGEEEKDEVTKDEKPKEEEEPKDEQPKEEQPKDQEQPQEDSN